VPRKLSRSELIRKSLLTVTLRTSASCSDLLRCAKATIRWMRYPTQVSNHATQPLFMPAV